MKLYLDIISDMLSPSFFLTYRANPSGEKELGRPRYYEGPDSPEGYLYFLTNHGDGPVGSGSYICWEAPNMSRPRNTSYIILPRELNLFRIYNQLQSIYDLFDEWENECLQVIDRYQDYRTLIRKTWSFFQLPILLIDNQFKIIAIAHDPGTTLSLFENDDHLLPEVMEDMISNPRHRDLETKEGVCTLEMDSTYLVYNLIDNGEYHGRLILGQPRQNYLARNSRILEKLAYFTTILLHRYGSLRVGSAAQNTLHSFFSDSLKGTVPSSQEIGELEQSTGWTESQNYLIAVFLPEHRLKKELYPPYLISQMEERWKGACAVDNQGTVVLLENLSVYGGLKKLDDFYQSLAYLVRDGLMIAGCSRPFTGLQELPQYFRQAQLSIEFGQKKDSTRWYFRFDDYGLDYLIQYGLGSFKPEQVCHPALLKLRDHDQEKNTSYYLTLYTFFRERYNMSRAAEKLYIHRSTFINRMERIEEIANLDLEDFNTRLYLGISFHLLKEPESGMQFPFYL